LSVEGRRRLVERCRTRPIAHVAAEMGISRQCASKWVNRYRQFGELGLQDRSSAPHRQPSATPAPVIARIETMRRDHKWPASRIAFELGIAQTTISRRSVTRHLAHLGLNQRRFIDPTGATNRQPRRIIARWPGHMIHLVKKTGKIPDGGGWRVHGKASPQARQAERDKKRHKTRNQPGQRAGYTYLHSAIDGYSRLAYTEALPDEKAATAIEFTHRARAFFAAHGITHIHRIVTDNENRVRIQSDSGMTASTTRVRARPGRTEETGASLLAVLLFVHECEVGLVELDQRHLVGQNRFSHGNGLEIQDPHRGAGLADRPDAVEQVAVFGSEVRETLQLDE
jgi:transposase